MAEDYPKHDYVMEREGLHNVCKYAVNNKNQVCPHTVEGPRVNKKIKDSVLDCVGNTPMIRINNITKKEGI